MKPWPLVLFLEKAFSTSSMMRFGIFLSAVSDRPNRFDKSFTSPRKCGTSAASGSGMSIAFRMLGSNLKGCGRNAYPMSKPKPLELELELLAKKTPRTSSLWKKTSDDCTLPAGRMLGPAPPPRLVRTGCGPCPCPVAGAGACPPSRGLAGAEAAKTAPGRGGGGLPPTAGSAPALWSCSWWRVVESLRNPATDRNRVKNRKQGRN